MIGKTNWQLPAAACLQLEAAASGSSAAGGRLPILVLRQVAHFGPEGPMWTGGGTPGKARVTAAVPLHTAPHSVLNDQGCCSACHSGASG
mmetsp:Transcript_73291/g.145367  ORF Transcript_73291/g.145367 Transcript_73291/m.145367 type:complete len:90 (-) Transcript_73291:148-417(-)